MSQTQRQGKLAESAASDFLQKAGLQLREANFHCRYGEIDLILCHANTIVFAEVRYRKSESFGGAEASVGRLKQSRLIAAAQWYLSLHPALARQACRFDVIAVSGDANNLQFNWIKNAFEA